VQSEGEFPPKFRFPSAGGRTKLSFTNALQYLFLPLSNLHWMHAMIPLNLVDSLHAMDRFQANLGLQFSTKCFRLTSLIARFLL
jgi:hypothetical protein